jgi:hypothetical protein
MAQEHHTQQLVRAEEKNMVLFCLVKDVYQSINPWARRYESLKLLSDSEALALVLFQQRRSVEPERSFLRDAAYFFTCSLASSASPLPRSAAPCASFGASWNS